ncbi:MAG: cation transporter [Clostridium sp.]|uniref:cation transporter n=1 Tax=Clostridium culturomicium TaxID=1499683 RepID=UPI00058B4FB4|nr:cation transporter [Clostridium culturomicium]MDU4892303.1 cation transporter [Clostridium sp.]MDU7085677.1 cation transporter [Clostridium sp.]
MKSTLKICDMITSKDVTRIKNAISTNEGVIACGIHKAKKEAEIVYDNNFISIEEIIESIENEGYMVI